jgi:hypothetical protein
MLLVTNYALSFASTPHHEHKEPVDHKEPKDPVDHGPNPCQDTKPKDAMFTDENGVLNEAATIPGYFDNKACPEAMDLGLMPQAGMDITKDGMYGEMDTGGAGTILGPVHPIMGDYAAQDPPLCAVNVHWHLGTEHRSQGEYDETGTGPYPFDPTAPDRPNHDDDATGSRRNLAGAVRQGLLCHKYDDTQEMFTKEYDWKYCVGMHVGQTYEVHWPHSTDGKCGTKWQYQTPFYDGVFCNTGKEDGKISLGASPPFNVPERIGVEGQVFVIANTDDPDYQNMDLIKGAWKNSNGMSPGKWEDVAKYVGSTTGTSRDNEVCSFYAPITWQVDRKCHVVSAASFDKMCAMMLEQGDDMHADLHPHGSRLLVADKLSTDTVHRKSQ